MNTVCPPRSSLYATTSTSLDVAQLSAHARVFCTVLKWRGISVCGLAQCSAVSTTEKGPCLRSVTRRPEGLASPWVVVCVVCTNTNCVNTASGAHRRTTPRANDSLSDVLVLRFVRMIIGCWGGFFWIGPK